MNFIKSVNQIAIDLLFLPPPMRQHTKINEEQLLRLSEEMNDQGKVNFFSKEPQEVAEKKNELAIVLRELVASSINYCYWYGNSLIRPNGANSNGMYNLVDAALADFRKKGWMDADAHPNYIEKVFKVSMEYLIELLSTQRYPLLEERKRHLLELTERGTQHCGKAIIFARYVVLNKDKHGEELLEELVRNFTGFASDTFLKRASLFFIQLNRQLDWFGDLVNDLFVPADYQLPKVLEYFGVIEYSNILSNKIQEGELIERGSLMECQLRAATILACKKLRKLTGWNVAEIDTWLWTKRKLPKTKFHLTYTTDY
jgi:hypothetical protein